MELLTAINSVGITVVVPSSPPLVRAVILSIEGVVLFDAVYDGGVPTVHRFPGPGSPPT